MKWLGLGYCQATWEAEEGLSTVDQAEVELYWGLTRGGSRAVQRAGARGSVRAGPALRGVACLAEGRAALQLPAGPEQEGLN